MGQSPKDVEWSTHGADLAATRYRPLESNHPTSTSSRLLGKTDSLGNRPEYKLEGTPLMVSRVI
jgi:hypothetical protein